MLINQLHQGGIRAVLAWDNTVFDNMSLPTGYSAADIINRILYKYGDTPLFTPDPDVLKYYITAWSARRLPLWNKYLDLLDIQYEPLENYNRIEDTTIDDDGTATHDYSGDDSVTRSGEDKLVRSGDDTLTKSGSEKTERDADTTREVSAYNSSAFQDASKDTTNDDTTLSFTQRKDTTDYNSTDTRTYTNLKDKTDYNSKDKLTNDLSRTIDSTVHGNIGVTTTQHMFLEELEVIKKRDAIEYIVDDWHSEFCLYIY